MEKIEINLNLDKIKGALVEKKISHQIVADSLGICRVTVTNMLNGKTKISAKDLYVISQLTHYDMSIFFEKQS